MPLPDLGSSLLDVAIRTSIVYAFLVVVLRFAGKREVGQMSIVDLVVLLVIADAVQNAMVGTNTSLLGGLVAAGVLVTLDRVLRLILVRVRPLRRAVEGEPRMLIRDGVVLDRALRAEGLSRDDLRAALREHGVETPSHVRLAVLEVDGAISVIPRSNGGPDRPA